MLEFKIFGKKAEILDLKAELGACMAKCTTLESDRQSLESERASLKEDCMKLTTSSSDRLIAVESEYTQLVAKNTSLCDLVKDLESKNNVGL